MLFVLVFISLVDCLIIYFFHKSKHNSPELSLNNKFVSLGDLRGKLYDDIVETVGVENKASIIENGYIIREWMLAGFYIALLFDENDVCLGIEKQEVK